jgi:hypothetical protein
MKGYKGFELTSDNKLKCLDHIFELDTMYHYKDGIEICKKGFHFCTRLCDVFNYYPLNNNIFCEIEAFNNIKKDYDKCCTDTIYIKKLLNGVINGIHFKDGKAHRDDDLPAIEYANGSKAWYTNGNLHRDNGLPAIEYTNGDKNWYVNGNLHRDNGLPAIEYVDGSKEWYKNGKLHRDDDLPAIEFSIGSKAWYTNGKRYRYNNLPTIEYSSGYKDGYKDVKVYSTGSCIIV